MRVSEGALLADLKRSIEHVSLTSCASQRRSAGAGNQDETRSTTPSLWRFANDVRTAARAPSRLGWRAVVTSALKVRRARQRMVSISAQHEQGSNDRYHDELPSAAVARSSDDEALA
jgi:hypothetical protein